MFRRANPVEKRLRKISKQEAASLKLLEKQEVELVKAVEENAREVEARLAKETPAEAKLKAEIDRVTRRLANLTSDMEKIRASRDEEVLPLRARGDELGAKLESVRGALALAHGMRERTASVSKLDLSISSISSSSDPRADSAPTLGSEDPPPYNFNQAWEDSQS